MPQTFSDVACTVCGCVCDDLRLTFDGNRLATAERACHLAQPWFDALSHAPERPVAAIDAQPATLKQAVDRTADILRQSRAPLIWGLSRSSTAGQRAAVFLAEQIGANIDTTASIRGGPSIIATQPVGESTCSLGEVRNRADLVIFWRADPAKSHPRHCERYSVDPKGTFVPRGRPDRHVIVIDSQDNESSRLADEFIKIRADDDFEVIWTLRQILRGIDLAPTYDAGVSQQQLQSLAQRMKSCRYGAVFFGLGRTQGSSADKSVEALLQLVRELNAFTRFTARSMPNPGDLSGAETVLSWLTGFPFAVNMARGYPHYNPGEYSANDLLERGEVDACLLVGSERCHALSPQAQCPLTQIPTIALDYPNIVPTLPATVQITTAIYGIHAAGTAYRMDEVPIPLRRLVPSNYPSDEEVLRAILARLRDSA